MKHLTLLSFLTLTVFAQCTKDYTDGEVSETDAFPIVYSSTQSINGGSIAYYENEYDFLKRARHFSSEDIETLYEFGPNRVKVSTIITLSGGNMDTLVNDYTLQNGLISEYIYISNIGTVYRYVYTRDSERKLEKIDQYRDGVYNGYSIYEYDNKGNRIRALNYDGSGLLFSSTTYDPDYSVANTIAPRNFGQRFRDPWQPNPIKVSITYDAQGNETRRDEYLYTVNSDDLIASRIWTSTTPNGTNTYYSEYSYE